MKSFSRQCAGRFGGAQLWAGFLFFLASLLWVGAAQESSEADESLSSPFYKSGDATVEAFQQISKKVRHSIAKLDIDGSTVALATIIDSDGWALTKASQLRKGKLTCWLAGGNEADAEWIATDSENDVALVRVKASGVKPIVWSKEEIAVGQWAITPGIETAPQAVGIVSVPPRKILHPRALIGIQLDFSTTKARVGQILAGMGAAKAGLKAGDIVLTINAQAVKDRDEMVNTLRNYRDGQTVHLRVQRAEEEIDIDVTMMAPKPEPSSRFDREDFINRSGVGISERAEGFELAIQHDTVLQPWLCGGPLTDLDGKAMGINIARAGRVASYALPAELARKIAEKLKEQALTKASKQP